MSVEFESFPVGPLGCNCTLLIENILKKCIVVDPGGDADKILSFCESRGLSIPLIIHTHGHFDHILAADEIRKKTGATIALHEKDRWLYENLDQQGQMFGMSFPKVETFDLVLDHQQTHTYGDLKVETLHTPGHTPGSVCFNIASEKLILSGDTLFAGSVGRTDLWGGSMPQMMDSIQNHLLTLDDSSLVIPGHGPHTKLIDEIKNNPFLRDLN